MRPIVIVAAVLGLALSLYSVVHHVSVRVVGNTDSVCNVSAVVNCNATTLSPYGAVFGAPIGVVGAAFFATVAALSLWQITARRRQDIDAALAVMGGLVALAVAALATLSVGVLHVLCPVCAGVYVCGAAVASAQLYQTWTSRRSARADVTRPLAVIGWLASVPVLAGALILAYPAAEAAIATQLVTTETALMQTRGLAEFLDLSVHEPVDDRAEIRASLPWLGRIDAPVVLTEFMDLECPNCASFSVMLAHLKRRFPGDILFVARHFPQDQTCNKTIARTPHPSSCLRSKAAICAHDQGRFWSVAELFFNDLYWIEADQIVPMIGKTMPRRAAFEACVAGAGPDARIAADIALAARLKINGTPGVFFNGRRYIGPLSLAALESTVLLLKGESTAAAHEEVH